MNYWKLLFFFSYNNFGKQVEKLSLAIAVNTSIKRHLILYTYSSCYVPLWWKSSF